MFPANSLGFYDVYGNVWEWLEDHFNGLPGFKTHYLYDDYSITYCDGKHNTLVVCTCEIKYVHVFSILYHTVYICIILYHTVCVSHTSQRRERNLLHIANQHILYYACTCINIGHCMPSLKNKYIWKQECTEYLQDSLCSGN